MRVKRKSRGVKRKTVIARTRGVMGRPQHRPSQKNRDKIKLLLAQEWSNGRIANALRISIPTLTKHYGALIEEERQNARDQNDAQFIALLWQQVTQGSVSAMRLWSSLRDQRDLAAGRIPAAVTQPERQDSPLGKKAAADLAAQTAHEGTPWESLLKH